MNEKQLKRELKLLELRGKALELLNDCREFIADYWLEFDFVSSLKSQEKLKIVIDGYKKQYAERTSEVAIEVAPLKKFAVQTNPAQQPIRVDASSIEKARNIAESFFGSIHDAYPLFDWVKSPAMLSEVNG